MIVATFIIESIGTNNFKIVIIVRNIIIIPSLLSPFVVPKRKISILSIQLTFYMFPTFHFYNCIAH
jgi:hypothetical protein